VTERIDIIQAEPGFWLLEACSNATAVDHYSKTAIVAWRVATRIEDLGNSDFDYLSNAVPITYEAIATWRGYETAILHPDGSVAIPSVAYFADIEQWMRAVIECRKETEQEKALRPAPR
jgi:hypothetical protein